MRILTVGNSFPPHDLGGGYEAVWVGAVGHLESLGHDVRVLTVDRRVDGAGEEIADTHRELRWYWRDHAFPQRPLREAFAIERHNLRVFADQVEAFRPDVVTWWSMGGMTLSLIEVARRRGLPAVAFVHDDWLDYGRRADQWHRRARRRRHPPSLIDLLLRVPGRISWGEAAHYAFVSQATRAHAIKRGLSLPNTSVIPSGIAPGFEPAAERDWRGRLLYVGRIDPRKGVATAIEALAHLPEAVLTIVGTGPTGDLEELSRRASSLGVAERVRFAGHTAPDALPAAYADADAVLFPVIWSEPWGLVPLEAMASGRPVIATGRGGSGEYLEDGVNALLYPAGDAAELAGRVRRLGADPALRATLREAGFATSARHTAAHFNAGVAEAIEAEVRRRGGRPRTPPSAGGS